MAFDFPATPTIGQAYTLNGIAYVWNGYAWMQSEAPLTQGVQYPAHGGVRLTRLDDSTLRLWPSNGNRLVILGESRQLTAPITIPKTQFAGTWGFIYAYWTGTAIAVEVSTTGHAPHTDGIEIKIGDASRTLVGYALMFQSTMFRDDTSNRLLLNWFNRRPRPLYSVGEVATASAAFVALGTAANFLAWQNDEIEFRGDGYVWANASDYVFSAPVVNDTISGNQHGERLDAVGHYGSVGGVLVFGAANDSLNTLRPGMRTTGAATATAQYQVQGTVWG